MTETTTKKDPFDFLFFYEFDTGEREEDALLVGGDDPSTASPLHLAIGIKEATKIVIRPISGVTTASSSNYHLKLQFTPGILLQPEQITVEGDDWDLKVEGDTIFYLLWKKQEVTLDDAKSLELMLNGVMGTLTTRASTTEVTLSWEFKRGGITIIDVTAMGPGDGNPYNNSATETLEMIQRQGKANIPLYVGFFSSNRVLNMNNQESELKLRITNTSESPITFNYDTDATNRSQLIVALEVGDAGTFPWALGTADQVNNVVVTIAGDKWQPAGPTNKGSTLEWTFSPKSADISLAAKETLVIELSKIVTSHPTGTANLYLRYNYVPGYQDGEFICPIEKAPLVFPAKNVGIGTTTPKQTLHVAGDYYGKGHMWLHATEGDGRSGTAYIQARDSSGSSTPSTIDLRLRTQENGTLKEVMHLDSSGNVGIGTITPGAKLDVNGGDALISGKVGIGTAAPGAKLDVNGGDALISGNVGIGTTAPGAKLDVNGGDALISGNVGIGTTAPGAKLHVNGGGIKLGSDGHGIEFNGGAKIYKAVGGGLEFIPASDESGFVFLGKSDNHPQLRITNGKVGIGTNNPEAKFEIIGTGTTFYSANSNKWDEVTIKNGNLGIGTNDPKGKLDVHGGKIRINGEPAMKKKTYYPPASGDNYNTDESTEDWMALIAGFIIAAKNQIDGIKVDLIEKNQKWILRYDGIGADDTQVAIDVIFIRREFF